MSPISRRTFLGSAGAAAGLALLSPVVARLEGTAAWATDVRRKLLVITLVGGNDGLNTIVPARDEPSRPRLSAYRRLRPDLHLAPSSLLPLGDNPYGLNPAMPFVHALYAAGHAAVVQGVDYEAHSYSHFRSMERWYAGGEDPSTGWIGRHLDRAGAASGQLRAAAIATSAPLLLAGMRGRHALVPAVARTRFADGEAADARARHRALARIDIAGHEPGPRRRAAEVTAAAPRLQEDLRRVAEPRGTGDPLADDLLTARALLSADLGVEVVAVTQRGYDTHTSQGGMHTALLRQLDEALELFWTGRFRGIPAQTPVSPDLASGLLVMVHSEFGRRPAQNGTGPNAGTDHGAAGPVLLLSSSGRLVGGFHGGEPDLGTPAAPADNLVMTTDVRRLYQSVLSGWLEDPEPAYGSMGGITGLFR